MCMYTYVLVRALNVYVRTCAVRVDACVNVYVRTCCDMRAGDCVNVYVRTYFCCACERVRECVSYVRICATHVDACVNVYVRTYFCCACERVRGCVCGYVLVFVAVFTDTHTNAYSGHMVEI